jgi:hypothetical protein
MFNLLTRNRWDLAVRATERGKGPPVTSPVDPFVFPVTHLARIRQGAPGDYISATYDRLISLLLVI